MYLEAFVVGLAAYLIYRIILGGFYTMKPDERAVITSINDLRKNLPLLNEYMERQCRSTASR